MAKVVKRKNARKFYTALVTIRKQQAAG